MYGLVNKAVQDLVISKFGKPTWEEIKSKAGVTIPEFVRMASYPDEITYSLVGAASEVLKLTPAQVLEAFGEYWMIYTSHEGYGDMMRMLGSTFVECLQNLNGLHDRLQLTFPDLKPPKIICSDIKDDSLRLHYYSDRPGLTPFVIGLLKGLAKKYTIEIQVALDKPKGESQDHDEFVIHILKHKAQAQ